MGYIFFVIMTWCLVFQMFFLDNLQNNSLEIMKNAFIKIFGNRHRKLHHWHWSGQITFFTSCIYNVEYREGTNLNILFL